ncbi:caspase family protein [Fulvivirga sp.]|uniref:caspase family protein n=1 Tax=Fulvivirga sp. TaxID=1931237 RepID=UPI0032EFC035
MVTLRWISKVLLAITLVFSGSLSKAQTGVPRIVINSGGHSGKIFNILYSPDGKQIISVSEDKTIRIWDSRTGEMIKKFEAQIGKGPEGMFYASAISSDGKYLAAAGYPSAAEKGNHIILIDIEKGVQAGTAVGHSNVINSLDFDGSGKYLASGSDDGTINIWSVEESHQMPLKATLEVGTRVTGVSFNNKTQSLAVASDQKNVLVYDLVKLNAGVSKFSPRELKGHKDIVNKAVYSPDGSYIASSSLNNEMFLWKPDGELVKQFNNEKNIINALTFSYDSKILVAMDVSGVGRSYSIPSGNKFADFNGHDNTVFSADFSPESETGNYIVATAGGNNNLIYIWNPINGRSQQTIKGHGGTIWDLSFGEELDLYISTDQTNKDRVVHNFRFDFSTFGITVNPEEPSIGSTGFLLEANKLVKQTGIYTLEIGKGNVIQNDEFEDGRILDYQVRANGNVIVGSDFSLKEYSTSGGILKEFLGHTGGVRTVTVSKNGKYMASGSEDQTINIWNLYDKGDLPSLRDVFEAEDWHEYFTSLEVDSLTYQASEEAWKEFIVYLKSVGDKTYKDIEEVYSNLGVTTIPFANMFVSDQGEWIVWAPDGYFSCSSNGAQYFGWHINEGINKLAEYYSAEQYFDILYRPETMVKSMVHAKRVTDILKEEGEKIFDLTKLNRPSAAFFNINNLAFGEYKQLDYHDGNYDTQSKTLELEADIYDGGGGIKEVNIYQNNKLILIDDEFETTGTQGKQFHRTYSVNLTNGNNEFKIVVKNFQKIESAGDKLKVKYVGEIMATSSLYILSVGINTYKNPAYNLNYAQPDAKSFTNKVIGNSSKMFKNVRKTEIYDTEATKENIIKGFESIISQAKPEDVFVFYYAGHGTLDEENDNEYYLVPTNITKLYGDPQQLQDKGISATELKGYLAEVKSQKQLILMDACHSGGAIKSMGVRAAASEEKAIVQLARASGVVMLASSGTQQFATEFEVLQHGVFTYALLEALDGAADSGDEKVTVNELKIYMDERVPELSRQYGGQEQYPTGFVHGNDFPISIVYEKEAPKEDEEGEK